MSPLQFQTMMIAPLEKPLRLRLWGRDCVLSVTVCWALKYHMKNSLFEARDYNVATLGLDGVE